MDDEGVFDDSHEDPFNIEKQLNEDLMFLKNNKGPESKIMEFGSLHSSKELK